MNTAENIQIFDSVPNFFDGRKVNIDQKLFLWELLQEDSECPSSALLLKMELEYGKISITIRHLNRLRASWGLSRDKGRPRKSDSLNDSCFQKNLIRVVPNLPFVGVSIFDDRMEQHEGFSGVMMLLKQAVDQYLLSNPEASFPLLNHREETILLRFKALFYAPLFGIGKLTEFDVTEHSLEAVIGQSYQSSTLNQYLSQSERIDASEFLMPALVSDAPEGEIAYIDGHMIPFWSKAVSVHKGKITMLGRIMAGSNAVVTHNENGNAVYFDYYPPDIRLPRVIIAYCENLFSMTGIMIFIIDREINSVEMAREFEGRGWGLLSMPDRNEHKDLSDWDTRLEGWPDDGSKVYSGQWKKVRQDDPRTFVIVVKDDKLLPFWGTSEVCKRFSYLQWPDLYTRRTELQENSFKRMIEHGALNINFGTKKIMGQDRHQARAVKVIDDQLQGLEVKIEKKEIHVKEQEDKVRESEVKGHGKRLSQRQDRLVIMQDELKGIKKKEEKAKDKKESLGEPKQRGDRDFRKQKIMTFRTLLLENALMSFLIALVGNPDIKLGMETLISLIFKRSGICIETCSEIIYKISTKGLSLPYRDALEKIIEGLNAMNINRKGKPITVQLRESPT
jgi:hypothetical protein